MSTTETTETTEINSDATPREMPWAGIGSLICFVGIMVALLAWWGFMSRYPKGGHGPDLVPVLILIPMVSIMALFALGGWWLAIFQVVKKTGWVGLLALALHLGVYVFWRGTNYLGNYMNLPGVVL